MATSRTGTTLPEAAANRKKGRPIVKQMEAETAKDLLEQEDARGRHVFRKDELAALLPGSKEAVERLVEDGMLLRFAEDVYVYRESAHVGHATLHEAAQALRPGEFVYESFESAASRWGLISQIPMRLTLATTGSSGEYDTPYGCVELTHTPASESELLAGTVDRSEFGELPLAGEKLALHDLKREDRCQDLLAEERLKEEGGRSGTVFYVN